MNKEGGNKNWFQKIGGTEGTITILFLLFFAFALIKYLGSHYWGVKEVGNFFEAPRPYTARYYVYLFEANNDAKNYKLPADITVDNESDGDGSYTVVYLEKAYFPNGGFIYFGDCVLESASTQCRDQNGKDWTAEFKSEKAKTDKEIREEKESDKKVEEIVDDAMKD